MCITLEPEDVTCGFHGSNFISKLDFKSALLQIPLDEPSSAVTVGKTPFGLVRWPFKLWRLRITWHFQHSINPFISDLKGAAVHQEKLTIHTLIKAIHYEQLRLLLERFLAHNVAISPNKFLSDYSLKSLGGWMWFSTRYQSFFWAIQSPLTPVAHRISFITEVAPSMFPLYFWCFHQASLLFSTCVPKSHFTRSLCTKFVDLPFLKHCFTCIFPQLTTDS